MYIMYIAYQKSPMGLTEKKKISRGSLYWDILDFFKNSKEMFEGI